MTGKATHKNGRHPSRDGALVRPINLSGDEVRAIGELIGRPMAPEERTRLQDALENVRMVADAKIKVTQQDIRATLTAIAKLNGEDVFEATRNCDALSSGIISGALLSMGCLDKEQPAAALIRAAALLALHDMKPGEGGSPGSAARKMFYNAAVSLWQSLVEETGKAWANADTGDSSRIVAFASILYAAVDSNKCPGASQIAKELRKILS